MFFTAKRIIATMLTLLMILTGNFDFAGVIFKPETVMAEYYVSTTGNDSNAGTVESPFATIERARDEVRKINDDMSGNIIVHVAEGTYKLSDTLTFDERDSASGDRYIRYIAD